jgi:hypothetical protein
MPGLRRYRIDGHTPMHAVPPPVPAEPAEA